MRPALCFRLVFNALIQWGYINMKKVHFLYFSLRIQAIINLRLYSIRKADVAKLKSVLDEHNKVCWCYNYYDMFIVLSSAVVINQTTFIVPLLQCLGHQPMVHWIRAGSSWKDQPSRHFACSQVCKVNCMGSNMPNSADSCVCLCVRLGNISQWAVDNEKSSM